VLEGLIGLSSVGFNIVDATVQFGDGTIAFQSVSAKFKPGKLTVILGPSGCGKTTLLRAVGDLIPLSQGRIEYAQDHPNGPGTQSRIGFCFQTPRLLPWATVEQNIRLPGRLTSNTAATSVDELLSWVDLKPEHGQLLPHELSGGMQMRVSLARALYRSPDLLLLDEPFAALDEFTRSALDDLLLRLVRTQNMSTLMVTHSVSEAVYLADEIWILSPHPGRLVRTCTIPFGSRTAALRASPEFAQYVAKIHGWLAADLHGRSAHETD
jgi:NitT/TauT family transport system ATP-binding protein